MTDTTPCGSYQWGSHRNCTACGQPAWDHDYQTRHDGSGPHPWNVGVVAAWLAMGRIDRHRATILTANAEDRPS